MDALLQGVLRGSLPLQAALEWALSSASHGPPPELSPHSDGLERASPSHAQALLIRPADFQVHVLNYVREQAELILAAAEQHGSPSHPPTPETQSKGQATAAAEPRPPGGQATSASTLQQQQQQEQQDSRQAQLQRASRRLEPGLVDDDNFPSLGAAAPPKLTVSPGGKKKKQAAKRTIMPAKVEGGTPAHPAFVGLPVTDGASLAAAAGGAGAPSSPPAARVAQQQAVEPASTPPPARPLGPAGTPSAPLLPAAAAAARDGGSHATPKRRLIPTRIGDGCSLQVSESFLLVSPSTVALPISPSSRTPSGTASRLGGAAATPFQLSPLEEQEVCLQLSFDANPGPGQAHGGKRRPGPPMTASPSPVQESAGAASRLEQLMAGMSLGAGSGDGTAGQLAILKHGQQQGQACESSVEPGAGTAREGKQQEQPQQVAADSWLTAGAGGNSSGSPARLGAGRQRGVARIEPCGKAPVPAPPPAAVPGAWGSKQQKVRAAPQPISIGGPWKQLPQQQQGPPGSSACSWAAGQEQQPACGALSYASVAQHPSLGKQQKPGGPHCGINPQLRSRLEAEPARGGKSAVSSGSPPATPPLEVSMGAVGTGSGGQEGGTPGSAAPKFPSPMEAVFRRLDAKVSTAATATQAGAPGLEQSQAWPRLGAAVARAEAARGGQGGNGGDGSSVAAQDCSRLSLLGGDCSPALPSIAELPAAVRTAASGGAAVGCVAAASPPRLSPQKRPAPLAAEALVVAAEPAVQLCSSAARLAELHAGLLCGCSGLALAGEVDLLMSLLAVPSAARVDQQLSHLTVLWCGDLAQQYACAVLQSAGGLARGLGPQLLSDLAALPLLHARFPRLQEAMQQALEQLQASRLHTEKAYNEVKSSSILSLFGLPAFTNDGKRVRTQEEQRRVSNRESCRDEWFNLMKEAAAQTHSFGARQLGGGALGLVASDRLSEIGSRVSTAAGGDEGSVLQLMQSSAADLLRRLRPDNFAAFAELFVAAVLQAAATGETIMDEELRALAKKNLSKFQRLNQRMQAGQSGPPGPSRAGAARLQHNQPMTAAGFWGGAKVQQQRQQLGGPRPRPGKGGGGATEEGLAASLAIISQFPRAQRLYVMFLEAADSHRLNSSLIRCMAAKLKSLTGTASASDATATPAALGERVVATSTLASFLSYLCFSHSNVSLMGGSEDGGSGEGAGSYDGSHPIDVRAALEAAAEGSTLAWTLPWAVRYLWFLSWGEAEEGGTHGAPYFRAVLARLQALRLSAALTPQHPGFGLTAFCLRSLLDSLAERMGPQLMLPSAVPAATTSEQQLLQRGASPAFQGAGAPFSSGPNPGPGAALGRAGEGSAGGMAGDSSIGGANVRDPLDSLPCCDSLLDRRYVQLCCPSLDHAQQLFRGRGAGGTAATPGSEAGVAGLMQRRVKKIRPTAPSGLAAARVALQVPAALQSAASMGHDLVKLRLQRSFLEQHSTEEYKVKLKDVVDYVADIIGYNSAASAVDTLVQPAIDAALAQLTESTEAAAVALIRKGQLSAPSFEHSMRLYVEGLAEQLVASTATQVLQQGQQHAQREIQAHAVRAMLALTPAAMGEAVVGTAAAIVAEVAGAACAQRLLSQVPTLVRQGITGHIDVIMKGVSKGRASHLAADVQLATRQAATTGGKEERAGEEATP